MPSTNPSRPIALITGASSGIGEARRVERLRFHLVNIRDVSREQMPFATYMAEPRCVPPYIVFNSLCHALGNLRES